MTEDVEDGSVEPKPGRGTLAGAATKKDFDHASNNKPWTIGYASVDADFAVSGPLRLEGVIPAGLKGTLYRNGPGRHERGDQRYGHRWDGDGMIQAFRFDCGVTHFGSFVRTPKYSEESAAGKFIQNAFGTYLAGTPAIPADINSMNVANINVCLSGSELLALWEPGPAYRLDPHTLETLGVKSWSPELSGMPFSAHPKREPDGTLWNFGANPLSGLLTLYCIGASGALERSSVLQINDLPMIHDFAVTEHHLVFLLSPLPINRDRLESGTSFAQACEWKPSLGTRVLTVSKDDWSIHWYQLPASCVFHIANAWEDSCGVIRVQAMVASSPMSLLSGWDIMRGAYEHSPGAFLTLIEIDPNKEARQTVIYSIEGEFPVVDSRFVGRFNRSIVCLGRSKVRSAELPGYDRIVRYDVQNASMDYYSYGDDWLVEEHVFVANEAERCGEAAWIVGTALNIRAQETSVSVFDAASLSAGPIAQATLPFPLPLGLHGCFVSSR